MPPAASPHAVPEQHAVRSPQQAARELLSYARKAIAARNGAALGTKGRPNAFVRAAQLDMGQVKADGIYGTATRARGKALLHKDFPARVSGGDLLYIP